MRMKGGIVGEREEINKSLTCMVTTAFSIATIRLHKNNQQKSMKSIQILPNMFDI